MSATVAQRLAQFVCDQRDHGVPDEARHEAKRLLLNQLKASVRAADHPAVEILRSWRTTGTGDAHVLWSGETTSTEHAAMVNGALFEVLDFHDTYIPTYLHAVSGVLPATLALAEQLGSSGAATIDALALGIEAELAVATILMPTGYFRGFVPLGLVGGVGAAVACALLGGLDVERTRNAVALAMCTAGGVYETVGGMGLGYVTASAARNGLNCYELAARGFTAPETAFEGDKGMLASYSDEPAEKIEEVLASLGRTWRIHGQSYKTVPTETITHAPVECVLAVRERNPGKELDRLVIGVEPIVVTIADERRDRFGVPATDLEARFDLRFCAAAAWRRGRFTLEEMQREAYTDEAILDLRTRVDLVPDPDRESFDGCWLEATFTDHTSDRVVVDAFVGSAANPMSDQALADLFALAATGLLDQDAAERLVHTVMHLDAEPDLSALLAAARLTEE